MTAPIFSSSLSSGQSINAIANAAQTNTDGPSTETKEAFQDFVGGTFFKMMLKSLRDGQEKSAYFHGGQAEDVFQGQLDQQVAEDLARTHGAAFADSMFQQFSYQIR